MRQFYILMLVFVTLLQGCMGLGENSFAMGKRLYQEGKYVEGVVQFADGLDQKGKFLNEKNRLEFIEMVNSTVAQAKAALRVAEKNDYATQLKYQRQLFDTYQAVNNKFYSDEFSTFLNAHQLSELKAKLAKLYYQNAQLIKNPSSLADYKLMADLYKSGLNYGDYRDTRTLYNRYNKLWRIEQEKLIAAHGLQNVGQCSEKDFACYREAARRYNQVADRYEGDANYAEIARLGKKFEKKGEVKVGYSINNRFISSDSLMIDREIEDVLYSLFRHKPYKLTNSWSDNDITIEVTYKQDMKSRDRPSSQRVLTHTDPSGTHHFTEHEVIVENEYRIEVTLKTLYPHQFPSNESTTFTVVNEETQRKITYSGDVPAGFTAYTVGERESTLRDNALRKLQWELSVRLRSVADYYSR